MNLFEELKAAYPVSEITQLGVDKFQMSGPSGMKYLVEYVLLKMKKIADSHRLGNVQILETTVDGRHQLTVLFNMEKAPWAS